MFTEVALQIREHVDFESAWIRRVLGVRRRPASSPGRGCSWLLSDIRPWRRKREKKLALRLERAALRYPLRFSHSFSFLHPFSVICSAPFLFFPFLFLFFLPLSMFYVYWYNISTYYYMRDTGYPLKVHLVFPA